jgi:hypothetical protein
MVTGCKTAIFPAVVILSELQIKKRKWKWIGHTIRKDESAVERIELDWNPQGTRRRGRPKKTWRRSVIEEAQRRKGVEGGEEVGSGQKSLEKLRGSPLLLHRRQ